MVTPGQAGPAWSPDASAVSSARFHLVKLLEKFGHVKQFDFLFHKSGPLEGQPRGYCFVNFNTREVRAGRRPSRQARQIPGIQIRSPVAARACRRDVSSPPRRTRLRKCVFILHARATRSNRE